MTTKTLKLDRGKIEVVDDVMADVLRKKTPAERIRIGFGLWTSVRTMLMAHLKREHPEWSEKELHRAIARRMSHGAV